MRKLLFGLLLAALPALGFAQVKISALPAATTPLTGTELTACVQGGVTDKCTVSSIGLSGAAVLTGDCTVSAGGVITCTKTQGVLLGTFATANTAVPPVIGNATPNAASFTTLSASSTVSGAGFTSLFASPPAIGGTAAAAGTFSSLTDSGVTGSTQCLHVNSAGLISGTGVDCGTGSAAFSGLTGGTNTTAAMVVGSGATLAPSGSGTITPSAISLTASGAGGVTPSGTANQIYTSQGTGSPPSWVSGVTLTGLAADSSPALADLFLIYSQSATATQSVTGTALATLFGAGTAAFNGITSGTNTTAAMVVGSGSTLSTSGSGTISATGLSVTLPITSGGTGSASSPSNGQIPVSNSGGTAYVPTTMHYDTGFTFAGVPANSQVFLYFVPDRPLTILSTAPGSTCSAKVAATGSTTLTLYKNGSSVATAVWSASGTTCSFTMASTTSWNGTSDTLEIDGPSTADATLATIGVVLKGTTSSP